MCGISECSGSSAIRNLQEIDRLIMDVMYVF
jgi:hypothetical protein